MNMTIKRALVSVSDKSGVVDLCRRLDKKGVEIISSGGTAKALMEAGISTIPIQEITGNPEAFSGRMKTLSFQVSSALLFRRGNDDDERQAKDLKIDRIDLVVCNLYPFGDVVKKNGQWKELIENIDIGGPTMIRAAAKNHKDVSVLTCPSQYAEFGDLFDSGDLTLEKRKKLALDAFRHTALYEGMIAREFEKELEGSASTISFSPASNAKKLRYGENPHQEAWVIPSVEGRGLAGIKPIQGKELSYNNFLDADAAWRCNSDLNKLAFDKGSSVTIIKHSNPCGAALGEDNLETLKRAWAGDPISSFGAIIAFNKEVKEDVASWLKDKFIEVLIAPSFSAKALELFSNKKNLRLLELSSKKGEHKDPMVRTIDGGWIYQEEDNFLESNYECVTQDNTNSTYHKEILSFGSICAKHLRSNAIVLVSESEKGPSIIGAGMGNPNRLVSLTQAYEKALENGYDDLSKTVLVSDAFFPFRDNIEIASRFGIRSIVQPGGSIKDQDVINCCNENKINMFFTKTRHFRH